MEPKPPCDVADPTCSKPEPELALHLVLRSRPKKVAAPQPVFCIHQGFFADPDFKNLDPDPSGFCFNKLMGSKWCSLIRFWRNLTKKWYEKISLYLLFGRFFIRIQIYWIGSGFSGQSGSGRRKISPIRIKGPGSETLSTTLTGSSLMCSLCDLTYNVPALRFWTSWDQRRG